MAGSAAPLVQPDEPGQTVPGVAPSSKFTNPNDPPPPARFAAAIAPGAAEGDEASLLQDASRRMQAGTAKPVRMTDPRVAVCERVGASFTPRRRVAVRSRSLRARTASAGG